MIVYHFELFKFYEIEKTTNIYENLPNNTSFPAAGFAGILRASSSEASAIPAPEKKTKEGE